MLYTQGIHPVMTQRILEAERTLANNLPQRDNEGHLQIMRTISLLALEREFHEIRYSSRPEGGVSRSRATEEDNERAHCGQSVPRMKQFPLASLLLH